MEYTDLLAVSHIQQKGSRKGLDQALQKRGMDERYLEASAGLWLHAAQGHESLGSSLHCWWAETCVPKKFLPVQF